MRTIKMGTSLTLILSDGTVITESNCTKEILDFVDKNSDQEDAIKSFFLQTPEVAKEIIETVTLVKDLKTNKSKLFKFDADTGITTIPSISDVSLPKHLIEMIQKAPTKELEETYLNFWRLCCRNPNEHSRNNTLWFLKQHGFTILKSGLFVAYRNVLEIDKGKTNVAKVDHSKEIKDLFNKVKKVYKKSPKTQMVIKLAGGSLITRKIGAKVAKDEENLGILHDLNNMANEERLNTTKFTDKHTKTFDIRLGKPISMPRDKCDSNPKNSCSRGLHVACKDWSGLNDFGNTTLAVLVNPVDVVAVPTDAGYSKMRVCQYYPLKVVEWDGKKIVEDIKDGDELDYWDVIIDGKVNNKDSTPYALEVPNLPKVEYTSYIKDITAIRDKMKSKLVK